MSPVEGEVFHIAMIYEQEYRKAYGDQIDGISFRRNSMPRRGDPRKSNLFRNCWKLRRETRGLLEQTEYRNYIRANLFIIKSYSGHVEPNCITGDKAWIRYKVWKRRYDAKIAEANCQIPVKPTTTDPRVFAEIDKTKKFLYEKCEGTPTFEKLIKFIDMGYFKLWVATGKISPYYLELSPVVLKSQNKQQLFSICTFSESIMQEKITEEIKEYFKKEYGYEFDLPTLPRE